MVLTVHHLQVSQSERIVWLCEELGIPYELKLYKRSPLYAPPEYKALHPMGASPTIQDGPITLAESAACVEYIIQKHGGGRLSLPPTHANYADYLYWFHFANGNLQSTLTTSMMFLRTKDIVPETHPIQQLVKSRLEGVLRNLEGRLGKARWLAGEEFTAADIMTVFSLTTMRVFYPLDLGGYPNILAWLKRVGERKAYREAMAKGDPGMGPFLGAEAPEPFMK